MKLFSVELKNPLILASGILGVTIASLRRVYNEGAGAVTTKSITILNRKGHRAPIFYDYNGVMINSVGLSNPGLGNFIEQLSREELSFPLIISIFGNTVEDFLNLVDKLNGYNFLCFELNLSCPNVEDEFGKPVSHDAEKTGLIVREVKNISRKPIIAKLSPGAPSLPLVAKTAEKNGVDALCISNTLAQGMVINIETGNPVLSASSGGISGKSIFPLTVKNIYDVFPDVSIPIIGTGGVMDANDALQLIMAGASFVGIGTAVYSEGLSVFKNIEKGINDFLKVNRIGSIDEIIGYSHTRRRNYFINPFENSGKDICLSRVVDVWEDSAGIVRNVFLEYRGDGKPEPGQFFMLWIPGIDQKPYSVSFFDDSIIGFSVKKRGEFSQRIFSLKKGDYVGVMGPLGRGFFNLEHNEKILLAGGGIGAAPLIFTAKKLHDLAVDVLLFMGAPSEIELDWAFNILKKFSLDGMIDVKTCTEDGSCGLKGILTDHLQNILENYKPDLALICGPELFIKRSISILLNAGIGGEASIERMMKCGVGICGSCCIDDTGERVCIEGPVFSIEHLSQLTEFGRYKRDESGSIIEI